jgi:hypothetical protein
MMEVSDVLEKRYNKISMSSSSLYVHRSGGRCNATHLSIGSIGLRLGAAVVERKIQRECMFHGFSILP